MIIKMMIILAAMELIEKKETIKEERIEENEGWKWE